MKSEGAISQKAKQLRFRHLKRELTRLLAKSPRNCKNNTPVESARGPLGVCKLDCKTCDEVVGDRSAACEVYVPLHTKEQIKDSLRNFFETRAPQDIAVRFPDVAALQWALEEEALPLFPNAIMTPTFWGITLWVDTEVEAAELTRILSKLHASEETIAKLCVLLETSEGELFQAIEAKLLELQGEKLEAALRFVPAGSLADLDLPSFIVSAPPAVPLWKRVLAWFR